MAMRVLADGAPGRLSRGLGRAIGLAACLQAALFGVFVARTTIRKPFMDMLDWIDAFLNLHGASDVPAYLWAFHNEHHLIWIRLLAAIDVRLFLASGTAFIGAGMLALLATAAIVTVRIGREMDLAPELRPLVLLAPMLLLTTANAVYCSIPINVVYPLTLVFLVGGLALFDSGSERDGIGDWRQLASLLVCAGAAFGNGVGLVIWPVLLWVGIRARLGTGRLLGVGVFAAGFAALYALGMPAGVPSRALGTPGVLSGAHLLKMATYSLTFLGLPFSRAPALVGVSRVIGAGLLIASVFAFVRIGLLRRATSRIDRFALGLMLIALGAVALAVIGRTDLDADVRVPVRYAVMIAPLHIGLLCLALPRLAPRVSQSAMLIGGLAACVILLLQQLAGGWAATAASSALRSTVERFYAGERDPSMTASVYPDLGRAETIVERMRREGLAR